MAREGLTPFLFGAGLLLVVMPAAPAAPPEDVDARLRTQLMVQKALQQGRDSLQRGDYQAAVSFLESQIARINGNRDYVLALTEAYRGYVRELRQANRADEAAVYLNRLLILDPGSHLDQPAARPATPPAAPAPAAQTPERPAEAPQAPAPPGAPLVRGKGPDAESGDVFADANSGSGRRPAPVRELLEQAEQEFGRERYAAAGRLYEQAHRADGNATAACRDQWAYCKLHGANEALNRTGGPPAEVEAEVRQALAMSTAPKLTAFGQDLLRRVQERRGQAAPEAAKVEVRHTPAQGQGWAVAETANFRVLHRQSQDLAGQVARVAEQTRLSASRKWFGEPAPPWSPRCDIYLHATAQDYARATMAPTVSPGHSSFQNDGDRVLVRRIDLHCDDPGMVTAVLPHEATHVVLWGRFGRFTVPRWADEGMAVLSEPRDRVERHLRNLPRHRDERTLFPLGQLMKMEDYPDPRSIGPFYAQGVSLVEFLSSQAGGPRVFAQFLRDGLEGSYEAALRRHYGIQGFEDLEQRWQQHAFTATTAAGYPPPAR
jgi:tetratricopeptide (TPR) repeat protein